MLEALEARILVVRGPAPANEVEATQLLGVSVSDSAAVVVVGWDSMPF